MFPILLSLALLVSGVLVAENPYNEKDGLSVQELVDIIKGAGFTDEQVPEAVRIVLLESKGIPSKLQEKASKPAVGLFQVDLGAHWDSNPEKNNIRKWFINEKNLKTREEVVEWLKDPNNNAETAYEIFQERDRSKDSLTGWEAWEAYDEGKKPDNREQSDWDIATSAMELALTLLQPKEDDVEIEEEQEEVVEKQDITKNVTSVGKADYESQVPDRTRSYEAAQMKANFNRNNKAMSPRKQKLSSNFAKLFEASLRAE